jgi:glycosyltransferase involved in cell wall biosynthesis
MAKHRKNTILIGPYPPPFGGVSIFIKQLYQHLETKPSVEFWFYSSSPSPLKKVVFFNRYQLPCLLLRKGWRAKVIESAHFILEYPSLLTTIWIVMKIVLRFQWVKIIHDGSLPSRYVAFPFLIKKLFHWSLKHIDKIVTVSEALSTWLKAIYPSASITVVQSLLPVTTTKYKSDLPEAISRRLSQFSRLVCSVGAFTESYGFRETIEAVLHVRRQLNENIGLVLIESGFARDTAYKFAALKQHDWIIVLSDVSNETVLDVMKRSSVFVRGFAQESFGISRIEALWQGTPVVATSFGETRGMITFEAGNVSDLAAKIFFALQEPSVKQDVALWAERFRIEAEQNLQKFLSIIED